MGNDSSNEFENHSKIRNNNDISQDKPKSLDRSQDIQLHVNGNNNDDEFSEAQKTAWYLRVMYFF